jgi:hypothetical protein
MIDAMQMIFLGGWYGLGGLTLSLAFYGDARASRALLGVEDEYILPSVFLYARNKINSSTSITFPVKRLLEMHATLSTFYFSYA